MKIVNFISVLSTVIIFVSILALMMNQVSANEWCWTKSMANDPSYVFNSENGGINWGFCKKKSSKPKDVKYTVSLKTSSLPNSGTESLVLIQFYGNRGMTQEKEIGSNIEAGSAKSYEITGQDVGDLNKIVLKVQGNQGYRCKEIQIKKSGGSPTTFQCLKKLTPCQPGGSQFFCQDELLPQGDSAYEITLKTSGEPESDTTSPILVSIIGEKGVSNYQMLSEIGAGLNSQIKNTIKINDVGKVTGYQIRLAEKGKWKGSHMIIKPIKTGVVSQFDLKDVMIENPGKDFYKFDISSMFSMNLNVQKKKISEGTSSFSTGGFSRVFEFASEMFNQEESLEEEEDDGLSELSQEDLNITSVAGFQASLDTGVSSGVNANDPHGGLIEKKEKKNIIKLDCMQRLINTDPSSDTFGPNYPTSNINYLNVIAECPSDCHKAQGQVYGLGIHPDISPICLSAIADKAISEYGGIISISIFPGLEKYIIIDENAKKIGLIKISSYFGHTKKSYTISKVDNVDLIEKDIRILDSKGNISYEGRVEIRLNGKWGTICNKKNNPASAKRICKDLGYNDGKWVSPDLTPGFCKTFKGKDYCSSENLSSIYNELTCDQTHTTFNQCLKKNANINECNHSLDAIISCTSQSYESGDLTPSGTVKLEKVMRNDGYVIGRLEIFNVGAFNPVCKNGFSPESAIVACKQMGYDTGDIINPDPEKRFTKDSENTTPFSASEVKCSGIEKKIFDCNYKSSDIQCTHDMDVVLKCEGKKGDPTGNSQIPGKNLIESPPALGKLTMIKLKVDCLFKGNSKKLRGDPGSLYIIKCPAHCKNEKGKIWGLGLYSLDSNVCHAAIHAGVITDEKGGSFVLTKIWGQKYYYGITRNGLVSSELNDKSLVSFTLSTLNSGWKNMWKLYTENKVGIFLEDKIGIKYRKNSIFSNSNKSTFIELENSVGIPKPIFEWIESDPSHNFSDKEKGSYLLNEHTLVSLQKYQIIIKASMSDFKNKKSFLFSYSGCGGFNLFLDESDTIIFGDPCNESNQINTGIPLPMNDKTIIWAFYENSKMKLAVFNEKSNKPIHKVFNKKLEIVDGKNIGIGRIAEAFKGFFYGYIDFVLVYKDEIPFSLLSKILDDVNNKNKSPIPDMSSSTLDNRDCISPCSDSPVPGEPGSPSPPKEADPYAAIDAVPYAKTDINKAINQFSANFLSIKDYSSSASFSSSASISSGLKISDFSRKNQGMISSSKVSVKQMELANKNIKSPIMKAFGSKANKKTTVSFGISVGKSKNQISTQKTVLKETYGTYDKKEQNNVESIMLDCNTNLKDKRFAGNVGRLFRVKCPSCQLIKRPVYGSFIYHPLSSICKSANHAGTLNSNESGYVIVELVAGKKIYNGSFGKDGTLSGTFSSSEISFRTKQGAAPLKVNCADSPNKEPFINAPIGHKFVVLCPKNCSKEKIEIFGSEVYTDTSSICISAIHYGVLNDLGGEIEFLIDGTQSFYKSTQSFGITSKQKDSYIRSFRFVGIKSSIFYRYKEDFSGKITDRWDIIINDEIEKKEANQWAFEEKKMKILEEEKLIKYIIHKGGIKSTVKNTYGSSIALKNAQWSNGRVKANFLFKDKNTFALLFKFVDKNNYYSLEFNPNVDKDSLKLAMRYEGSTKILQSQNLKLTVDSWYRVEILMMNQNIRINIQNSLIRENKTYFNLNLKEIARGSVAFATNGNNNFFINGIEIDDYIPHANKKFDNKNRRSWIELIKRSDSRSKKKFCQTTFKIEREEQNRCFEPHYYCKLKCDEHIPVIENILNFNCFRDCVKKIKMDSSEFKLEKTVWIPKINEKVDFLPQKTKKFRPGTIDSIKEKLVKGKMKKMFTVIYFDIAGNSVRETTHFPSNSLFKCGDKLVLRKDCK